MLNFELCFDNNKLNTSLSDLKSERVTFDMPWGSYRKPVPPKDTGTMKWGYPFAWDWYHEIRRGIYEKENFRKTDKASRILDCYRDILVHGDGILSEKQLPNL